MFLTALACHVGHTLRHRLNNTSDHQQLEADTREWIRTWAQLTKTMGTVDGQVWSQQQDIHSNTEQVQIAATGGSFRGHRQLLPLVYGSTTDGAGAGKEKEPALKA